MIRAFLLVLLSAFSAVTWALEPITEYRYQSDMGWHDSLAGACGEAAGRYVGTPYAGNASNPISSIVPDPPNRCKVSGTNPTPVPAYVAPATRKWCTDGSAPNTSLPLAQQCPDPPPPDPCPPPQYQDYATGECMTPRQCPTGYHNSAGDPQLCFPDVVPPCTESEERFMGVCIPRRCPTGQHMGTGVVVTPSGTFFRPTCVPDGVGGGPDPNQPDPDKDKKCPDGSAPVDGQCKLPETKNPCPPGYTNLSAEPDNPNCTKPERDSNTTTTRNPDGSTTTTTTENTRHRNPDGTTTTGTTTTITTCQESGTCTTTTTTGTGTEADKGDDLCKKNPNLNICRNSTVSGDCENTTCEGDAITCALLRQQRKEYCENTKENPQTTLGNQLLAGNDPLKSTLPTAANATGVNLGQGALDTSGFMGGGSCFADKSFSVMGQTFVIPFSAVCNILLALRFAIMIIASLVSFRMVSGVIFRE